MRTLYKLTVIAAAIALSGCFKDLDTPPIDPNVTQTFQQDGVFAKIYATLSLTGIGSEDGGGGLGDIDGIDGGTSSLYRMQWSLNEFSADGVWWVWTDAGIPEVRAMTWDASNDLVKGLYARLYFDIALCNYFLAETETLADAKTARQRAEVRFIRALNYYLLLDMYGEGVPFAERLIDELPVQPTDLPKPTARKDLFAWIEAELLEIETEMFADGDAAKPYYRAGQAAVWLLLSRMYLNAEVYTGKPDADGIYSGGTPEWSKAAEYAGKVMSSSYQLAPVYRHLFMGDNDNLHYPANTAKVEIILPIAQDGVKTQSWGGSVFLIAGSRTNGMNDYGSTEQWDCWRAKQTLVRKFFPSLSAIRLDEYAMPTRAGDDRCLLVSQVTKDGKVTYTTSISDNAENGSEAFKKGWGIAKFTNLYADTLSNASNPRFPDMDIPYFRAAEAYLTYAEAVVRGGTPTNGSALDAVNELRNRAHATPWTGADLTLPKILDEWAREFYAEGRRRIDLVRHNKFAGYDVDYIWEGKGNKAAGQSVHAKYNIFPIPQTDLTANQNLKASPGY